MKSKCPELKHVRNTCVYSYMYVQVLEPWDACTNAQKDNYGQWEIQPSVRDVLVHTIS